MEQATNAIKTIKPGDLKEMAALNAPAEGLKVLGCALCALFQREESWPSAQKFMGTSGFLEILINYDKDNVPMKVIRHVQQNYTEHGQYSQFFVPDVARKASAAAEGLVQWITGLILYRTILEQFGGGQGPEPAGSLPFDAQSPLRASKPARPSSAAPSGLKAQTFTPVRGPKGMGAMDTPQQASQLRALSPTKSKRKARPQTASKGAQSTFQSSPVYQGLFKQSSPETKKKKKPEVQNMISLVAKKDRLAAEHVHAYLKYLLDAAARLKDPKDDILKIFDKITNWK